MTLTIPIYYPSKHFLLIYHSALRCTESVPLAWLSKAFSKMRKYMVQGEENSS